MKAKDIPGIPPQIEGAFHDTESQQDISIPEMVAQKYVQLKKRFLDINSWREYCGETSTDFRLYNSAGEFIHRDPEVGDFVRIDIPGPGNFDTKGYDWVEIVKISDKFSKSDETESLLIICRPSIPPNGDTNHIAHFYARESTSSFRIAKGKNFIRAEVYGRNEKPNFSNVGFFNKIRNFLITIGGFAKVTKIQWKCLADGLLDF